MMKVKHIFSSRRSKKNKSPSTSDAPAEATNHSNKLITQSAASDSGNSTANDSYTEGVSSFHESRPQVVLRRKPRKTPNIEDPEGIKDRSKTLDFSTSRSRRPWSFIDQIHKHDKTENSYSSPLKHDDGVMASEDSSGRLRANTILTLPRSAISETVPGNANSVVKHLPSSKRRTIDFRFFNFFKRSGDSVYSEFAGKNNPNNFSFRGKNWGRKIQSSKKRKDREEPTFSAIEGLDATGRPIPGEPPPADFSTYCREPILRVRPPVRDHDLDEQNVLRDCDEILINENDKHDSEVVESTARSHDRLSCPSVVNLRSSVTQNRRSDPTSSHSILRKHLSDGNTIGPCQARSLADSCNVPSRRSSTACEPRESPLPEDCVACFDRSVYIAQRNRALLSDGSVGELSLKAHAMKVGKTRSNDVPTTNVAEYSISSQSCTNLTSVPNDGSVYSSRLSCESEGDLAVLKLEVASCSKRQTHNNLRESVKTSTVNCDIPPSPVLRAIGYPGVVLRSNRDTFSHRTLTSAQRAKQVMSLNMEDLPTYHYDQRFDHEAVSGYPSCEDILSDKYFGVQYPGHGSNRSKLRGTSHSTHGLGRSVGFTNAVSMDNLETLSNGNYSSKQSLMQLDRTEPLDAMLARKNGITYGSSTGLRFQEPSLKKTKAIRKSVVSLANLISPGKPNQKSKLQRSSSFKESSLGMPPSNSIAAARSFKPYKPPSSTPNKNRKSKLWCETFDCQGLTESEIRRQEAIYELFQGEKDLVHDLTMAKQTYRDSMVTLKMLSDEDVTLIFGKLGCLLPLHEELLAKLEDARGEDGRAAVIGCIFVEWLPRISTAYQEYCANQSDAKYALDAAVERGARVRDFLQRCLESPFSRKLDLWSYLDLPRTRLVKYPLLLQNILKRTPQELQEEQNQLMKALEIIGKIIKKVDATTGEQQCRYFRSKLDYLDDKQKSPCVENSRLMLCSGQLKNNRGTKMHVFLFEEALVLTRQTTRSNKVSYQVYRRPLPLRSLVVDSNEGERVSGSFRGGILSSDKVKHSFRVKSEELNASYTLQASDEHDKKQWINTIHEALAKYRTKFPDADLASHFSKRRATYDPTKRNLKSEHVSRSSSHRSSTSVASSSDKSTVLDESQDDLSTTSEELTPWDRARSKTINVLDSTTDTKREVSTPLTRSVSKPEAKRDASSSDISNGVKFSDARIHTEANVRTPVSVRGGPSKKKESLPCQANIEGGDEINRCGSAEIGKHKLRRTASFTTRPRCENTISSRPLSRHHSTVETATATKPQKEHHSAASLSETVYPTRSAPDLSAILRRNSGQIGNDERQTFFLNPGKITVGGEISRHDRKDDISDNVCTTDSPRDIVDFAAETLDNVSDDDETGLLMSTGDTGVLSCSEQVNQDLLDADKNADTTDNIEETSLHDEVPPNTVSPIDPSCQIAEDSYSELESRC